MRTKFYLFLFVLLTTAVSVVAQNINVKGTVVDEGAEPVVGASIVVKGTQNGTTTDLDGKFQLSNLKANDILTVSFVGMKTVEAKVKPVLKITLEADNEQLDEVIVVAFGEAKKSSFTGSATVVKSETLEKKQLTNVFSGLQGEVPGLQMINNSGSPTATPTMRIRGLSSINAGTSPLIIVDGAPYDGGWNNLNPNDVESISVLKDAASNALYGARGANGVVMITTKKGKAGKATITLDAKWGSNSRASKRYDLIDDPAEYYELHYKALYNYYTRDKGYNALEAHRTANSLMGSSADNGGLGYIAYAVPNGEYLIGTNGRLNPNATLGNRVYGNGQVYTVTPDSWLDEGFRNSLRQEYNLNFNGGVDQFTFYGSLGYLNNEGIVYNSDMERYTTRFKADYQARPWLKLGANLNYAHSVSNGVGTGGNSLFDMVNSIAPIYPVYLRDGDGNIMTDQNGKMYDYGSGELGGLIRPVLSRNNPLQENSLNMDKTTSNAMTLNGFMDITPLEGLKITLNGTVSNLEGHNTATQQPFYGYGAASYPGGYVYKIDTQTFSLNFQEMVSYVRDFGKHNVSVMIGHENYKYDYQYLSADRENMYSYFGSQDLNSAIKMLNNYGSSTKYNTEGYFSRALYNYDERYFLSVSYRRDASSRFHPDHRWGNFYSFGGAWAINKENFMKDVSWVDMLKLKASWGQQGNDAIGDFRYTDTYSINNTNGEIAFVLSNVGNPNITWETNSNFNVGADFELLKNRVNGSIEYFSRKTTDMLCFVYVPLSAGYAGSWDNIGDMLNKGVEVSFDINVLRLKDLRWNINLNATHFKNKISKLNEDNRGADLEGHPGYVDGYYYRGEGLPYYTWRLKKFAGLNENGQSQWYIEDADGNVGVTSDYSSATYYNCGTSDPDLYGGFGTNLTYKGFDFSINFNYSIGGMALDNLYMTYMTNPTVGFTGTSYHKDLLNAWSETNTNSNIPRFQFAIDNADAASAYTSDKFLTKANYLTLQNVNLGYTLPRTWISKIGFDKLRVYVSGDNLFYWSKRKGFDPRGTFNGNTSTTGYSPVRVVTGGITAQF
jgi:TonB-linked SusC/RagA family outer membrane protein